MKKTIFQVSSGLMALIMGVGLIYAAPLYKELPDAGRFVVSDGTHAYRDRETGLVWDETSIPLPVYGDAGPNRSFRDIQRACLTRFTDGRGGWRVPTLAELMSVLIRDPATTKVDWPSGHPFNFVAHPDFMAPETAVLVPGEAAELNFVTSTFVGNVGEFVAVLRFTPDGIEFLQFVVESGRWHNTTIWCVRGGTDPNPRY